MSWVPHCSHMGETALAAGRSRPPAREQQLEAEVAGLAEALGQPRSGYASGTSPRSGLRASRTSCRSSLTMRWPSALAKFSAFRLEGRGPVPRPSRAAGPLWRWCLFRLTWIRPVRPGWVRPSARHGCLPGGIPGVELGAEVGPGEPRDRGHSLGVLVRGLAASYPETPPSPCSASNRVSRDLGPGERTYGSACQSAPRTVRWCEVSLSPATTSAGVVIAGEVRGQEERVVLGRELAEGIAAPAGRGQQHARPDPGLGQVHLLPSRGSVSRAPSSRLAVARPSSARPRRPCFGPGGRGVGDGGLDRVDSSRMRFMSSARDRQ